MFYSAFAYVVFVLLRFFVSDVTTRWWIKTYIMGFSYDLALWPLISIIELNLDKVKMCQICRSKVISFESYCSEFRNTDKHTHIEDWSLYRTTKVVDNYLFRNLKYRIRRQRYQDVKSRISAVKTWLKAHTKEFQFEGSANLPQKCRKYIELESALKLNIEKI